MFDYVFLFRNTIKSPQNVQVVQRLVKEVRGLNPSFDAVDIRGKSPHSMCRLQVYVSPGFPLMQMLLIGFISPSVKRSLLKDVERLRQGNLLGGAMKGLSG